MKNCQICNKSFESKSKNQKNCEEHKGLYKNMYSMINNVLHKKCVKCLESKEIEKFYSKKSARCSSWCKDCFNKGTYIYQSDRALDRKLKYIKKLGNKCSICSYNKNLAALAFHHIDESKKRFELDSRSLSNRSEKEIEIELKICILICHNCHMETHYPQFNNKL